jgi:hypothetical protein
MNKLCVVNSNQLFDLIGKIVLNKRILLDRIQQTHPVPNHPVFEQAEELFILQCDKNYTYYHLRKDLFPNVSNIYCLSHPCDPRVFNEFTTQTILLSSHHSRYKPRWFADNHRVIIVDHDRYVEKINSDEREKFLLKF